MSNHIIKHNEYRRKITNIFIKQTNYETLEFIVALIRILNIYTNMVMIYAYIIRQTIMLPHFFLYEKKEKF